MSASIVTFMASVSQRAKAERQFVPLHSLPDVGEGGDAAGVAVAQDRVVEVGEVRLNDGAEGKALRLPGLALHPGVGDGAQGGHQRRQSGGGDDLEVVAVARGAGNGVAQAPGLGPSRRSSATARAPARRSSSSKARGRDRWAARAPCPRAAGRSRGGGGGRCRSCPSRCAGPGLTEAPGRTRPDRGDRGRVRRPFRSSRTCAGISYGWGRFRRHPADRPHRRGAGRASAGPLPCMR